MQWISDAAYRYIGDLLIFFWQTANKFADLERDTSTWIWPFKLLSEPLGLVAYYLHEVHYKLGDFREEFQHYTDFLNDLWGLTGLNKLISWIWWEWETFKRDPKAYISSKLNELIVEWPRLLDEPGYWLIRRLYEYDVNIWNWVVYPVASFKYWLGTEYPELSMFLTDAVQGLRSLMDAISVEAGALIADPVEYLKETIIRQLGWSRQFWLDPWGYLFSEIINYADRSIGVWSAMLAKTSERIIRYVWEGRI